jgi:hypothetical protein
MVVLLTIQKSYELFANYGCFAREICDKCGIVLGAVRFTRKGDSGAWCSRECRDGNEAHAPGTCRACHGKIEGRRKGSVYCSDSCKQAGYRSKADNPPGSSSKLSVTKPSIYAPFCSVSEPGCYHPTRKSQNGLAGS